MGVSMGEVFNTLQVYLGVAVRERLQSVRPHLAGERASRRQIPQAARRHSKQLKIRNVTGGDGAARPLLTMRESERARDGRALQHVSRGRDQRQSPGPGTSSGQAIARTEDVVRAGLEQNPSMRSEWTELALLQLQTGNTAMLVFVLAVVLVFLVLAAQYESWSLPLAVILVVPMCLLCSVAGVIVRAHGYQHLHADRLRRAGRSGVQERDSDRRIRQGAARKRRAAVSRRRSRRASSACGRS